MPVLDTGIQGREAIWRWLAPPIGSWRGPETQPENQ